MPSLPWPTRRDFLARLSALGALGALGVRPSDLPARQAYPTRAIPGTGETLPIVGLGSTGAVLEIPEEGTEPVARVLRTLLEGGGRVVDTSPRTVEVDTDFGGVLNAPDLRGRFFLATKINTEGAEEGVRQMRQNTTLLARGPVDLVQVESLRDVAAHWPNLRAWKEAGETRYIGVTVSTDRQHGDLEAFMRRESPDFVHMNYSVMETGAEERLLPLARDRGMAVLINRPFMNGSYFQRTADRPLPEWTADFGCESWAQFSLKYILADPAVTCVLTETTDPSHMAENLRAGLGRFPDAGERRRMREVARTI